jgi:hypothetical protein
MKNRTVVWMLVFLFAVAVVVAALFVPLRAAFLANPLFNGMIIGVLAVGIGIVFQQVLSLQNERVWLDGRQEGTPAFESGEPRMLAPLARMLSAREGTPRLSATVMRSLLDGIRLRLDQNRDISRYLVGLLIFLGLLGTFWGLLDTVVAVSKVIASLQVAGGDVGETFGRLRDNLQGPLAGMGTAFSSSLFGLAGALVLGFLDLQAGHAENRFFKELEDWLAELTHLPSSALLAEGERTIPAYVEALLEKTADSLEGLERILSRGEEDRTMMREQLLQLTARLADLTDQIRGEQQLIKGLARQHQDLQPIISRLAAAAETGWGMDDAVRAHFRNMDLNLRRLAEEGAAERRQQAEDLRNELRLLTRTIAGRSGGGA